MGNQYLSGGHHNWNIGCPIHYGLTLCLWFIWLSTASWNFLVTSSECQRKSLLEDILCTFQPLAKGDLVDHILHTLIMYKDCLGIMKEQCKNSRLPHLLMIVMHGETLWSPAPQPMDDDDDDNDDPLIWHHRRWAKQYILSFILILTYFAFHWQDLFVKNIITFE